MRRLDRIGEMAIRKAEMLLGRRSGEIDSVNITVELDLGAMSDDDAASVWAEAIVFEVLHIACRTAFVLYTVA